MAKKDADFRLVKTHLRKLFMYSQLKNEILKSARIAKGIYQCSACQQTGSRRIMEVDHIVSLATLDNQKHSLHARIGTLAKAMFDRSNCRVICGSCHTRKTVGLDV